MSWLGKGISESVNARISQLGGQLKDILTESTEDTIDPDTELTSVKEKLKENERYIEMLKMENNRWKEESNELTLKCQTYETQLEQKTFELRQISAEKDSQIVELKKQIDSKREANELNNEMTTSFSSQTQKSAFMEEFEELDPPSELSDYIQFQKEIKRLNEDNLHLIEENRELMTKLKLKNQEHEHQMPEEKSEPKIDSLQKKISALQIRVKAEREKHKLKLESIEENYSKRLDEYKAQVESLCEKSETLNSSLLLKENEIADLTKKLSETSTSTQVVDMANVDAEKEMTVNLSGEQESKTDAPSTNDQLVVPTRAESATSSTNSNKSDDGWCINAGDELNLDLDEKLHQEKQIKELEDKLREKDNEIEQLNVQIQMFENELEQANALITRLKAINREATADSNESLSKLNESLRENGAELDRVNVKLNESLEENRELSERLEAVNRENEANLSSIVQTLRDDHAKEKDELEQLVDKLRLEIRQYQESTQQERMMQMQEEKKEKQELAKLRNETTDLKIKLDEKTSEIKLLGDQINELNANINTLRTNDTSLFEELRQKTETFVGQLDAAHLEIASLKSVNQNLLDQVKQLEFVLDEKARENSQLKQDIQSHMQHISAQSKAIEKMQVELQQQPTAKAESMTEESIKKEKVDNEDKKSIEEEEENELSLLKQQYNQLYAYVEQKNQESLTYYNEIQRLNVIISDLNVELKNSKRLNENLNEQYENLVNEFQLEQKMVEDLNQHTSELNDTLMTGTKGELKSIKTEPIDDLNEQEIETKLDTSDTEYMTSERAELVGAYEVKLETMTSELDKMKQLINERDELAKSYEIKMETMSCQLDEAKNTLNARDELAKSYEIKMETMSSQLDEAKNTLNARDDLIKEYEANRVTMSNEIETLKRLINERDELIRAYEAKLQTVASQLETKSHDESLVEQEKEKSNQTIQQLKKELTRLKEHLVEMSDAYTKDAIMAEEREKQLRNALSIAETSLQEQGENLQSSSKEVEQRVELLQQLNEKLNSDNEKLNQKLMQTEESLEHQIKVANNLELVLERLQNEKDEQHLEEIKEYQKHIKEHLSQINQLKTESESYQAKIRELKQSIDQLAQLEFDLAQRDETIKQLEAKIGTKDSLIESIEKRVNESLKINESYIEKEMIKNLIIGYIKVTQPQERKQVLKLISTMLNFSKAELDQIENVESSNWFGSFLRSSPTSKPTGASKNEGKSSFTELLIQYVDRESKPKTSLAFDLNDPTLAKKTDSPSTTSQLPHGILNTPSSNTSASAIKFFNTSLTPPQETDEAKDRTLVNRSQVSSSTSTFANIKSPEAANSFLEQILKK